MQNSSLSHRCTNYDDLIRPEPKWRFVLVSFKAFPSLAQHGLISGLVRLDIVRWLLRPAYIIHVYITFAYIDVCVYLRYKACRGRRFHRGSASIMVPHSEEAQLLVDAQVREARTSRGKCRWFVSGAGLGLVIVAGFVTKTRSPSLVTSGSSADTITMDDTTRWENLPGMDKIIQKAEQLKEQHPLRNLSDLFYNSQTKELPQIRTECAPHPQGIQWVFSGGCLSQFNVGSMGLTSQDVFELSAYGA